MFVCYAKCYIAAVEPYGCTKKVAVLEIVSALNAITFIRWKISLLPPVLERHRLIWKKIKYQPNSYISFKTCLIYIICKLSMIKMTRSLPYLRIGTVFYFQAFPNRATRVSMRTKSWRYSKSKTV